MEVRGEFVGDVHVKMHQREGLLNYETTPIPSRPSSIGVLCPSSKTSPAVLFVIVILAVLFFISGLLHLLVRFLTKTPTPDRTSEASASSDTLQRQLQQLFHLHDSGLDQAFIDALPVFTYKEIIGLQDHFDCAVCLCEFLDVDKLRLLPMCGHAFHMSCIDTWLLSNSSCPLCRGTLLSPSGFSIENPMFDFDDLMEDDRCPGHIENIGLPNTIHKTLETEEVVVEKGGFPVRLGKFKELSNADSGGDDEIIGSSKLDARRCYSMGSYQYVVGNGDLRVALSQSRGSTSSVPDEGKRISIGTKTDSYSVSKIWMWSKKAKFASSSPAGRPEDNI